MAPAGLGSGWAAPAVGLGPALSAPVSLGMFAGGSLPHLPRGPPEHMDGGRGQREVGALRSEVFLKKIHPPSSRPTNPAGTIFFRLQNNQSFVSNCEWVGVGPDPPGA